MYLVSLTLLTILSGSPFTLFNLSFLNNLFCPLLLLPFVYCALAVSPFLLSSPTFFFLFHSLISIPPIFAPFCSPSFGIFLRFLRCFDFCFLTLPLIYHFSLLIVLTFSYLLIFAPYFVFSAVLRSYRPLFLLSFPPFWLYLIHYSFFSLMSSLSLLSSSFFIP